MKRITILLALVLFAALLPLGAFAEDYPFLLTAGGSFAYSRDDQGNLLFYATDFGKTTIEPYSHGFARIGESGGTWVLIDRDGNLLLSELYVDQYSMPRLDIY